MVIYEQCLKRSYDFSKVSRTLEKSCARPKMFGKLDVARNFGMIVRQSQNCRKVFCKSGPGSSAVEVIGQRSQSLD